MVVNSENLKTMFQAFTLKWQEGVDRGPKFDVSFLYDVVLSQTASEAYPFLEQLQGFREWIGPRIYGNAVARIFELENKDFEDTVRVPLKFVEDDKYGMFANMMKSMAMAWMEVKYNAVLEVILKNPKCFTGNPIFYAGHEMCYSSPLTNVTTDAFSKAAYEAAFAAAGQWSFKTRNSGADSNSPCKTTFTHILHGYAIANDVFSVVGARQMSDGAGGNVDNPHYQEVIPVKLPEFTGDYANFWCLVDCKDRVKPVTLQIRREAVPVADLSEAWVIREGNVDILAYGRAAAAPTFPHLFYCGRHV